MRIPSEEIEAIGKRLIDTIPSLQPIKDKEITICYLISDKRKKQGNKNILAECTKVAEAYQWAVGFDYMITIYLDGQALPPEKLPILIHHELLHIDPAGGTRGHDIDEFMEVADKYGLHWVEE